MLVNVQDRHGNSFTILTEAAMVISGQTIYSDCYFIQSNWGVHTRVYLKHNEFVTITETTGDRPVITISSTSTYVMLNLGIFLLRNIHLRWVVVRMQKAMRKKLARIRALSFAMGFHPRLGEGSLVRKLPTDLVHRLFYGI